MRHFGWVLALALFLPLSAVAQDSIPANPTPATIYANNVNIDDLIAKGAQAVIDECDRRHNPFSDQTIHTKMVLNGGVHKDVTYVFDTFTKGETKRSVRFKEPAEMNGMGVVIKGRDEVYARLPDSPSVRRVATHAKRQSFYGSDWSMDDMSIVYYGKDFTPKILDAKSDNGTHVKLQLDLKDGVDLPFKKLVIKVDRSRILIDYIELYDDNLQLIKTQTRDTPKDLGNGYELYTHLTVTDAKTNHKTENFVLSEKINQNIPDSTFTKRWLVNSL